MNAGPFGLPESQQGILSNTRVTLIVVGDEGRIVPISAGILPIQDRVDQDLHLFAVRFGVADGEHHQIDAGFVDGPCRVGGQVFILHEFGEDFVLDDSLNRRIVRRRSRLQQAQDTHSRPARVLTRRIVQEKIGPLDDRRQHLAAVGLCRNDR